MSRKDFMAIKLLLRKSHIILQGAPGVGKTKRLAYAMMRGRERLQPGNDGTVSSKLQP